MRDFHSREAANSTMTLCLRQDMLTYLIINADILKYNLFFIFCRFLQGKCFAEKVYVLQVLCDAADCDKSLIFAKGKCGRDSKGGVSRPLD